MAHGRDSIPIASRVNGNRIVELLYDPAEQRTALAVSENGEWRIEQEIEAEGGQRLVPYAASNNLIRHGCLMLPSEPLDHGGKKALLEDIESYLHRYVDLSPLFERIAAHYALLSWVYDAFNEIPYLRFRGQLGSGKTRALLALGSIAYRGFFASGASTVSPVFHVLDGFGGTLVLDEADLRFSGKTADLVKILNNGTVKGLPVLRTLQNKNREFSPAAFDVFGPKILAMRGRFRDEALESRFITAEMAVRPLRPDIPIQLPDELRSEALGLRNRLLHYRLTQRNSIRSEPERVIPGLDPRLNQMALSILSMMDDPQLRGDFRELLQEKQAELSALREDAGPKTLGTLRDMLHERDYRPVSLRELANRLNAESGDFEFTTARQVGQTLREFAVPLQKSHGTIVVPGYALAHLEGAGVANKAPPQSGG